MKKETVDFRMRTCTLGGSQEGGKVSTHSETPSQLGTVGTLEPQRGRQQHVLQRQNRKFTTEVIAKQHFPAQNQLTVLHPQRVGSGCSDSDFRVRPQGAIGD